MSDLNKIPNMTNMDPAQLVVLKSIFGDVQKILQRFELAVATGALPAVPPDMVLLTAMSAVLTGAKRWEVPAKNLLSNHLAAACFTEEEAQLAVAEAFKGRRAAEQASGVSHGPPTAIQDRAAITAQTLHITNPTPVFTSVDTCPERDVLLRLLPENMEYDSIANTVELTTAQARTLGRWLIETAGKVDMRKQGPASSMEDSDGLPRIP